MSVLSNTCPMTMTSGTETAKPSRIRGLFTTLRHEFQVRQAMRQVSALDDTALFDIGISRGGIEDAVRCGRR